MMGRFIAVAAVKKYNESSAGSVEVDYYSKYRNGLWVYPYRFQENSRSTDEGMLPGDGEAQQFRLK